MIQIVCYFSEVYVDVHLNDRYTTWQPDVFASRCEGKNIEKPLIRERVNTNRVFAVK